MPHRPDRLLRLQGASNFRDLGGYPAAEGRVLRWRQLFRSDHLGGLTDADRAVLASLGLARAFDFRGAAERAAAPNLLPGVVQHALEIEPTVVQRLQQLVRAGHVVTAATVASLMKDLYRSLVDAQAPRFADLFEQLLQAPGPVVFHCTAGKDRTGVAAALLLLALGVPRPVVTQDYLLSNAAARPPPSQDGSLPAEALAVLWQVQPDFLDTALRAIDADHGGVDRYLQQRLGLGAAARNALAAKYLVAG